MAKKTIKVITRRKKFVDVEIPLLKISVKIIGNNAKEVEGKIIKLDLTRQLKGKSLEINFKVKKEGEKAVAHPVKIRLLGYFIRRMMRKRISYVEDSFLAKSKESLMRVKPFMITRKKVSRAIRKTLRNRARNWLEDYLKKKEDYEIFRDIITNKIQKPLSLTLKKTYPLSLCEIRVLQIERPLKEKVETEKKIKEGEKIEEIEKKIEEEEIKEAEEKIRKTQEKAAKLEEKEKKSKKKATKSKENSG